MGAAVYMAVVLRNTCYFAAGPDSSGYMNAARLLSEGRLRIEVTPIRDLQLDYDTMIYVFTPLGFARGGNGTMVPTYPAGMPLHMAAVARFGGWKIAPFLVSPFMALGSLVLCVLVGRELGLSVAWGIAAAAILAAFPVFLSHAIQPVSDVVATFWALATIWCALRSFSPAAAGEKVALSEAKGRMRGRSVGWFAVAAGAAFAVGVWVRPTNFLMAVPLAFALRWRIPLLARAVAGAIPFGLALMAYQTALYGKPWLTGYGSVINVIHFDAFRDCFPFHTGWLVKMATPLVMPGGLLVGFDRKVDRFTRIFLLIWFGVFFVFYVFYPVCDEWFSIRFLMPGVPALIFGLLLVMRDLLGTGHRYRRAVAVLVVVLIVAAEARVTRSLKVLRADEIDSVYPESVRWAERLLPPDAFVLSGLLSGPFLYYSNRITARWDQIEGERTAVLRHATPGRPWYAVVSAVEADGAELNRRIPGGWVAIAGNRDIILWRLDE